MIMKEFVVLLFLMISSSIATEPDKLCISGGTFRGETWFNGEYNVAGVYPPNEYAHNYYEMNAPSSCPTPSGSYYIYGVMPVGETLVVSDVLKENWDIGRDMYCGQAYSKGGITCMGGPWWQKFFDGVNRDFVVSEGPCSHLQCTCLVVSNSGADECNGPFHPSGDDVFSSTAGISWFFNQHTQRWYCSGQVDQDQCQDGAVAAIIRGDLGASIEDVADVDCSSNGCPTPAPVTVPTTTAPPTPAPTDPPVRQVVCVWGSTAFGSTYLNGEYDAAGVYPPGEYAKDVYKMSVTGCPKPNYHLYGLGATGEHLVLSDTIHPHWNVFGDIYCGRAYSKGGITCGGGPSWQQFGKGAYDFEVINGACPSFGCGEITVANSGHGDCDGTFTLTSKNVYTSGSGISYFFNLHTFRWYCGAVVDQDSCSDGAVNAIIRSGTEFNNPNFQCS